MLYTHNPSTTSGAIPMDLLKEFKKKGNTVKLVVNSYHANYAEDIVSMETFYSMHRNNFIRRVKAKLRLNNRTATDPKYHFSDLKEQKRYYKTDKILKKAKIKPDAIILFFVKGFLNSKNIYELNKLTNAPVYMPLYDMAPLTGGCHYAWECKASEYSCKSYLFQIPFALLFIIFKY